MERSGSSCVVLCWVRAWPPPVTADSCVAAKSEFVAAPMDGIAAFIGAGAAASGTLGAVMRVAPDAAGWLIAPTPEVAISEAVVLAGGIAVAGG